MGHPRAPSNRNSLPERTGPGQIPPPGPHDYGRLGPRTGALLGRDRTSLSPAAWPRPMPYSPGSRPTDRPADTGPSPPVAAVALLPRPSLGRPGPRAEHFCCPATVRLRPEESRNPRRRQPGGRAEPAGPAQADTVASARPRRPHRGGGGYRVAAGVALSARRRATARPARVRPASDAAPTLSASSAPMPGTPPSRPGRNSMAGSPTPAAAQIPKSSTISSAKPRVSAPMPRHDAREAPDGHSATENATRRSTRPLGPGGPSSRPSPAHICTRPPSEAPDNQDSGHLRSSTRHTGRFDAQAPYPACRLSMRWANRHEGDFWDEREDAAYLCGEVQNRCGPMPFGVLRHRDGPSPLHGLRARNRRGRVWWDHATATEAVTVEPRPQLEAEPQPQSHQQPEPRQPLPRAHQDRGDDLLGR